MCRHGGVQKCSTRRSPSRVRCRYRRASFSAYVRIWDGRRREPGNKHEWLRVREELITCQYKLCGVFSPLLDMNSSLTVSLDERIVDGLPVKSRNRKTWRPADQSTSQARSIRNLPPPEVAVGHGRDFWRLLFYGGQWPVRATHVANDWWIQKSVIGRCCRTTYCLNDSSLRNSTYTYTKPAAEICRI